MQSVHSQGHKLEDYQAVTQPLQIEQLKTISIQLKDKKIYEINATGAGGGVAELLTVQIPLYRQLGIDAQWLVLPPNNDFFSITKNLHNCLQGKCELPTKPQQQFYVDYLKNLQTQLPLDGDIYILHDPQTLGLASLLHNKKLIWRCHIDLTGANVDALSFVTNYYQYFQKLIFSMPEFASSAPTQKTEIIHPSIDPLNEKNHQLSQKFIDAVLEKFKIDFRHPFILQVSRFDKFKDPLGVIELYSRVKKNIPELQCVLVGSDAADDPEGKPYFQKVKAITKSLEGVKLITNATDKEVNALQRAAAVVVQNSTKEGFGLTVTEAMWKQKLVCARPVGGIKAQIVDQKTGFYLSPHKDEATELLTQIVKDSKSYTQVAAAAKERVRKNFLLPKMCLDYLKLYSSLLDK